MSKQAKFNLFNNITVQPGGEVLSPMVNVGYSTGYFAIAGTVQGDNINLRLEYMAGDGANFVAGSSVVEDSLDYSPFSVQFYPEFVEFMKIKVTNNSLSPVVICLNLIFSEE